MREFIYKVLKSGDSITKSKFIKKCLKIENSIQYAHDAFKYASEHRIIVFEKWVSEDSRTVRQYVINL
jgi:hypothetical protein